MEGKLIYLVFLALYFYFQYRAAQKKKQQKEVSGNTPKEKPTGGRGFRTLDDILKEAQKQIQEANKKKETKAPPVQQTITREKSFSSSSYKSLADKHNKSKSVYTPLTSSETFTNEGESVFTEKELAASHINEVVEAKVSKSADLDLRQAIIAEAILNRPYA